MRQRHRGVGVGKRAMSLRRQCSREHRAIAASTRSSRIPPPAQLFVDQARAGRTGTGDGNSEMREQQPLDGSDDRGWRLLADPDLQHRHLGVGGGERTGDYHRRSEPGRRGLRTPTPGPPRGAPRLRLGSAAPPPRGRDRRGSRPGSPDPPRHRPAGPTTSPSSRKRRRDVDRGAPRRARAPDGEMPAP